MSSLAPYSVGTCLCSLQPQKSSSSYSSLSPPVVFSSTSTNQYLHHKTYAVHPHPPLAVALLPQSESKSNPTTHFKRRDALCLAFSFGLLHPFFQPPQPSSAATDTTAPCEFTVAPSGLAFCDKLVGTGPQALKGQLIKAHYVGRLENGKIFDSSYNRGKPLTFRVGVGEVIKGWDEGILGADGVPPMLAGGKRTLKLPPGLGYGSRAAGCRGGSCIIPPDSVLLFDVEFISKASFTKP